MDLSQLEYDFDWGHAGRATVRHLNTPATSCEVSESKDSLVVCPSPPRRHVEATRPNESIARLSLGWQLRVYLLQQPVSIQVPTTDADSRAHNGGICGVNHTALEAGGALHLQDAEIELALGGYESWEVVDEGCKA